jgi:hypothetical protein
MKIGLKNNALVTRSPGIHCRTKTNAVMPMMEYVTTGAPRLAAERILVTTAGFVRGADARCSRMHSGQITPTGAWVWHSGQIVRPHR